MDGDRARRRGMLRISSWVVVAAAAFLAVVAFTEGRVFPGVFWALLGLSNVVPAAGLDERSVALRRAGQALTTIVLVMALIYLYTLFS